MPDLNLAHYWSPEALTAGTVMVLHLLGALGLGIIMGYERVYHGRAAGLRTYALVCMAACALTLACGFPDLWYGARLARAVDTDPTRVIQGIMTGIGFLGAGVIMREGQTIRGLSTAASIWMAAAIGVMVGLGLYIVAIAAALITTAAMAGFRQIEGLLPHYNVVKVLVRLHQAHSLDRAGLTGIAAGHGFEVTEWSYAADRTADTVTYELVLQTHRMDGQDALCAELGKVPSLIDYKVLPVRD